MSTTTRRPHRQALALAEAFRAMFDPSTYLRWEFAGSLRRKCGEIGDIEHVVIPRVEDVPGDDMFATPARRNLLFDQMDDMLLEGRIARHIYGNGQRWGEKYRGADFSYRSAVVLNEVFCADESNWGPTLAIRTGSADFSRQLVSGLLRNGRRNKGGKVWRCERCQWCDDGSTATCSKCDQTGLLCVEEMPCPTEKIYFELCGIAWTEPEDRR